MPFYFKISILFLSVFCLRSEADLYRTNLQVVPYSKLALPPQIAHDQAQWMVQQAALKLYGVGFVDLGDFSDFMHGHILFRTKDLTGSPPDHHRLTDLNWTPDWTALTPHAVLFHTQEFGFTRPNESYVGPNGPLTPNNRNWILWLTDTDHGRRGDMVRAENFVNPLKVINKHTITSDDLDPKIFGENPFYWEYSFFFYRVSCADADSSVSSQNLQTSNIIRVAVNQTTYCLALSPFQCEGSSPDANLCNGGDPIDPVLAFPNWAQVAVNKS